MNSFNSSLGSEGYETIDEEILFDEDLDDVTLYRASHTFKNFEDRLLNKEFLPKTPVHEKSSSIESVEDHSHVLEKEFSSLHQLPFQNSSSAQPIPIRTTSATTLIAQHSPPTSSPPNNKFSAASTSPSSANLIPHSIDRRKPDTPRGLIVLNKEISPQKIPVNSFSPSSPSKFSTTPSQQEKNLTVNINTSSSPSTPSSNTTPKVTTPLKPITNYKKGEIIGQGANGRVYTALNFDTGQIFAIKEITFANIPATVLVEKLGAIQREISLMKSLRHENIVQYLGAETQDVTLNIFMEYISGGSLSSLLHRFGKLSEELVKIYTKQILQGILYLHQNRIVHRDIKGANILVSTEGVLKLADFGASRQIQDIFTMSDEMKSLCGTVNFLAPEVIMQSGYGRSVDIWSIGCTVIEMYTGKPPFSEFTNAAAVMFHIASTTEPPKLPEYVSQLAKDFIYSCFIRDPQKRPTAEQLLQHNWLKQPSEILSTVNNAVEVYQENSLTTSVDSTDSSYFNPIQEPSLTPVNNVQKQRRGAIFQSSPQNSIEESNVGVIPFRKKSETQKFLEKKRAESMKQSTNSNSVGKEQVTKINISESPSKTNTNVRTRSKTAPVESTAPVKQTNATKLAANSSPKTEEKSKVFGGILKSRSNSSNHL